MSSSGGLSLEVSARLSCSIRSRQLQASLRSLSPWHQPWDLCRPAEVHRPSQAPPATSRCCATENSADCLDSSSIPFFTAIYNSTYFNSDIGQVPLQLACMRVSVGGSRCRELKRSRQTERSSVSASAKKRCLRKTSFGNARIWPSARHNEVLSNSEAELWPRR